MQAPRRLGYDGVDDVPQHLTGPVKTFTIGDRVHLAGLGTGIVRQLRSGGCCAIEIKGRLVVVSVSQLEPAGARRKPIKPGAAPAHSERRHSGQSPTAGPQLDLHGMTVAESLEALKTFINDALLDGRRHAQVVHGRSGGRVKAAVHQYLRGVSAVETFRVDPGNAGVTIVTFA